jgi:hypothetical protein
MIASNVSSEQKSTGSWSVFWILDIASKYMNFEAFERARIFFAFLKALHDVARIAKQNAESFRDRFQIKGKCNQESSISTTSSPFTCKKIPNWEGMGSKSGNARVGLAPFIRLGAKCAALPREILDKFS